MNMSKIRVLIDRPAIYTLQTNIVLISNHKKLLGEVVFSIVVSMNPNTKKSQTKYCPYLKYVVMKRSNLYNLHTRKNI